MSVLVSPSGFELLFPIIVARGLAATDILASTVIFDEFGIEVTGPPLSDEDLACIVSAVTPSARRDIGP